ncbi:ion channel [Ruegeria sp.]|uniref:potassium channel family protein n=1 Tax=Ruegeria sp. TaxID=1879320 RepID=UPI003C79995A
MAEGNRAQQWIWGVIVPLVLLVLFLLICMWRPRTLLETSWQFGALSVPPLPIFLIIATSAGLASVSAHFSRHIPNWAAWSAILLSALFTILIFAVLNSVAGVFCTAAVCPTATAYVFQGGLPVIAPEGYVGDTVMIEKSFRTALYFSVVTFTTLGYGDMQPSPSFRLYAGYQAVLGYMYLGMIVGVAIDHGANIRGSGSGGEPGDSAGDHPGSNGNNSAPVPPQPEIPKDTPAADRSAPDAAHSTVAKNAPDPRLVQTIFLGLFVYCAGWIASSAAFGLPGFYLPALLQVPIIFGGLIWISFG